MYRIGDSGPRRAEFSAAVNSAIIGDRCYLGGHAAPSGAWGKWRGWGLCAGAAGALMAHRMAWTIAWPAGRTSTASDTGRRGRGSWRRGPPGRSESAAAARTAEGGRGITGG